MSEIARLREQLIAAQRVIWMLVQENGGTVILNRGTMQSYPGDSCAAIETTHQPESGSTIYRAVSTNNL